MTNEGQSNGWIAGILYAIGIAAFLTGQILIAVGLFAVGSWIAFGGGCKSP